MADLNSLYCHGTVFCHTKNAWNPSTDISGHFIVQKEFFESQKPRFATLELQTGAFLFIYPG